MTSGLLVVGHDAEYTINPAGRRLLDLPDEVWSEASAAAG
jgi:hypothetical protein